MRPHERGCAGGGLRPAALAGPLVALATMGAAAGDAAAHTALLRASADASSVSLTFATPVPARLTTIDVLAATGGEVEWRAPRNAPRDPTTVTFPLRGAQRSGRYVVKWSTASEDGHVVSGVFDYTLRAEAPAPAPASASRPAAASSPSVTAGALSVARIAQDAALVLALGLVVFLAFVWRPSPALRGGGRSQRRALVASVESAISARLRKLLVAAAAAGAASAAAAVLLQSAAVVRASPWDGTATAALPEVLVTRAGTWWVTTGVAWLALVLAARRANRWLLAGLAAVLVITPPVRGHGADSPLGPVVVVHVAAVGAWLGGLVALLVTAHTAAAGLALRERLPLFASVVERFGVVALPCALAVLVTGIVRATGSLADLGQITSTGYGRLVAVKVVLFTGLVAVAAYNRRSLILRLRRVDTVGAGAAATMRRTIVLELALAGLALTAAGVLAGTAPPS